MKTTPPEQYFTELRPETLLKWDLVHQKRLAAHFILCFKNCTSKVQTMHCTRPPAELYFTVCFYSKHLRVVLILNCGQVNHIIYSSKLNPSLSITVLCKGAKRSESQSREYWLWKIHPRNCTALNEENQRSGSVYSRRISWKNPPSCCTCDVLDILSDGPLRCGQMWVK